MFISRCARVPRPTQSSPTIYQVEINSSPQNWTKKYSHLEIGAKLYCVLWKIDQSLRRCGCSLRGKYCLRAYNTRKKIVFLFVFNAILYSSEDWNRLIFSFRQKNIFRNSTVICIFSFKKTYHLPLFHTDNKNDSTIYC